MTPTENALKALSLLKEAMDCFKQARVQNQMSQEFTPTLGYQVDVAIYSLGDLVRKVGGELGE